MLEPSICPRRRATSWLAGLTLAFALAATAQAAPRPVPLPLPLADQLHALALQAYRQGRFPEAYGRFVALADAGHAPAARQALWMCEHGLAQFGRDWDCAPHQVEDWAAAAGHAAPRLPRHESISARRSAAQGRQR